MNRSFVVADIPGLIEGAAEGAGLGHQFLRHLARTRLLLHLVDIAPFDPAADPVRDARAIVDELKKYDEALYRKPRWLVLNKTDLLPRRRARSRGNELVRRLRWKGPWFVDLGAHRRRLPRALLRGDERAGAQVSERLVCATQSGWSSRSAARSSPTRARASTSRRWRAGRPRSRSSRAASKEVVLVSSGAIAEGMQRLGWTKRPHAMHELQAAAAVGQMGLVQVYETCFREARPAHRPGAADARRPRRPAALPERALDAAHAARARASSRSSTRTTPSSPTRSASATTTRSARWSPT